MSEIKRSVKQEEKFKLILEAAEKLMKEKGLHSLNMDEVAKLSNLAKGTLYLYFKSKEEVFAALAFKARVLLLKEFEKETAKFDEPVEQLKAIITANYNFLKRNSLFYELVSFYEINERQTETEEMQLVIKEISELVIRIIEKGQKQGTINKEINPTIFSFTMWGMTVGVMQLLKAKASTIKFHPELSEKAIVANFIRTFEQGLKKND